MSSMKSFLKSVMPPSIVGYFHDLQHRLKNVETALDVMIDNPRWTAGPDVGFNGQNFRKQMFADVIAKGGFDAILETGTWIGNTTGYMATTAKIPVHTSELNSRFHRLAKMRLQGVSNVNLELLDSRAFLRKMAAGPVGNQRVFIYLDAHWYDDLPLKEEIEIISQRWSHHAIMIDDFAVPGDAGYGYDDYLKGEELTIDYLRATCRKCKLEAFFPSAPSSAETGARRGSVILAPTGPLADQLAKLPSLVKEEALLSRSTSNRRAA